MRENDFSWKFLFKIHLRFDKKIGKTRRITGLF